MLSLFAGLIDYWPLYGVSGGETGRASGLVMADEGSVGSADGKVVLARDFNGSNQRLVHANDAAVQCGDISFTWCCWVKLDAINAVVTLISKDNNSGTGREFNLDFTTSGSGRFRFHAYRSGPTAQLVAADTLGTPSIGVWYFISAWHNATADTVNIQMNALSPDSAATTGALQGPGAGDLHFGSRSDNSFHLNGQLCEIGFWKRVLASHERAWLYNQGRGRGWPFDGRPSPIVRDPHLRRTRVA